MKCPLREDMLGRMPECEQDCSWLTTITLEDGFSRDVCAVQLIALKQSNELSAENDKLTETIADYSKLVGKVLKERGKLRRECNDYKRRLSNIREIATFPLCLDYKTDQEETL